MKEDSNVPVIAGYYYAHFTVWEGVVPEPVNVVGHNASFYVLLFGNEKRYKLEEFTWYGRVPYWEK